MKCLCMHAINVFELSLRFSCCCFRDIASEKLNPSVRIHGKLRLEKSWKGWKMLLTFIPTATCHPGAKGLCRAKFSKCIAHVCLQAAFFWVAESALDVPWVDLLVKLLVGKPQQNDNKNITCLTLRWHNMLTQ